MVVAGGRVVSTFDCYAGCLPFPFESCGEQQLATILVVRRWAGVVPEVNLREHTLHMPLPSANKAAHSAFETQRRCHQKFKPGVSVAP